VLEHKEEVMKLLSNNIKIEELETEEDVKRLIDIFVNNKLLMMYNRMKDEVKKYKYPKKLYEVPATHHEKQFYGFFIYKPQTKMTFIAIGLAVAIIAIILFPLWPYSVKLAIFNILFYFSASFIGMTIVRLLVWVALFPFGIDFWIFPRLFDEEEGIIDSFIPFLSVSRRNDGWDMFIIRIFVIVLFAIFCYKESGLPLPINATLDIYNDVFEWGKDKMVGNETTALQYNSNSRPSLEDILKATEDYKEEEEERMRQEEEEKREKKEEENEEDENQEEKRAEDL
jgi:translocation protein SEC62